MQSFFYGFHEISLYDTDKMQQTEEKRLFGHMPWELIEKKTKGEYIAQVKVCFRGNTLLNFFPAAQYKKSP